MQVIDDTIISTASITEENTTDASLSRNTEGHTVNLRDASTDRCDNHLISN